MGCIGQIYGAFMQSIDLLVVHSAKFMEGSVAIVSDLLMGCRQVGMGIVKKQ